jgi:hypothetical protein
LAVGLTTVVYLSAAVAGRAPRWQPPARRLARAFGVRVAQAPARFSAGLMAVIGLPLILYVAINEIKFDTPFNIPVNHQVFSLENAHRQAVLAANDGSLFGLKFLPTNLLAFARPDALSFTRLFPWVFFPGRARVLGHYIYDTRDWASSVPSSMPALFLLALAGVVLIFRSTRVSGRTEVTPAVVEPTAPLATAATLGTAVLRLPLVGAAVATAGILTIAFIAERYLADAMPLVLLAGLAGWHGLLRSTSLIPAVPRAVGASFLVLLALFELWTTLSLSLFYQREIGPSVTIPQRAGMVGLQEQIDRTLVGGKAPGVQFVTQLPITAPPLNLAVVGNCAAVYQFDRTSWQPVELGSTGGGGLLEVTFPRTSQGRRQPLLVTGGAIPQDVVAVTWEGGDRYSFSYRFAQPFFGQPATAWYTEPAVTVAPGRPHRVQLSFDDITHGIFISVDGASVFSLLYPVALPVSIRVGSAPPSLGTTPVFAGRIRSLPVPTPICHALEHGRTGPTTSGS